MFLENQFCSLLVWDLLRLAPWSEICTTHSSLSIEFWLIFDPQIRPTIYAINFLFITSKDESKVRLCVKLLDCFPKWILVHFTWNLSRFVPDSVEILTRYFWKKNYFGRNFQIFCANQGYPLPKLMKFRSTFCNFFLGLYHTSTFIYCLHLGKETHWLKKSQKEDRGRKPKTLWFWKISFVHSRPGT